MANKDDMLLLLLLLLLLNKYCRTYWRIFVTMIASRLLLLVLLLLWLLLLLPVLLFGSLGLLMIPGVTSTADSSSQNKRWRHFCIIFWLCQSNIELRWWWGGWSFSSMKWIHTIIYIWTGVWCLVFGLLSSQSKYRYDKWMVLIEVPMRLWKLSHQEPWNLLTNLATYLPFPTNIYK